MKRRRIRCATGALLYVLLASACGGANPEQATEKDVTRNQVERPATIKDFNPNQFDQSTNIDNEWLPEKPGTRFVYVGEATEENERISRRVVTTITDLTKVINGVRTVVAWDRDYNDGELVEEELAFHAQDNEGNVWNLGEYPEEYEEGKLEGAPETWIAGLDRAKAGILMRAEPRPGTSSYLQGLAPEIEFKDHAKVYKTGQKICVPSKCYENVLVIEEWDPVEPGTQHKYHAPGVGIVRVGFSGGKEKEELVLERVVRLSPEALAKVRQEALELDRRAYKVRKELYRHTPPARHT
jgi:hypothetical protein